MPDSRHQDSEYSEEFVARVELKWGEGFLSPGGPGEVSAMLKGLDISGKEVLDIGCGLGGVDIALAEQYGAGAVLGIDIDSGLIERAKQRIANNNNWDKITLQLVEPGPLPFDDASFGIVFSKDALFHIPDKQTLYIDILRVLRPGGWFVASDWLKGPGSCEALTSFFRDNFGMSVELETLDDTGRMLEQAGFVNVTLVDRHEWYRELARRELQEIRGPRRQEFTDALGEEATLDAIDVSEELVSVADSGELRPAHMRGQNPGRS